MVLPTVWKVRIALMMNTEAAAHYLAPVIWLAGNLVHIGIVCRARGLYRQWRCCAALCSAFRSTALFFSPRNGKARESHGEPLGSVEAQPRGRRRAPGQLSVCVMSTIGLPPGTCFSCFLQFPKTLDSRHLMYDTIKHKTGQHGKGLY